MKVGDKLYCKKPLSRFNERPCNFFKDKLYTIIMIGKDKFEFKKKYGLKELHFTYIMLQDEFNRPYFFYIPNENTDKKVIKAFYILMREKNEFLYDYFYSPQELRKIKLQQLQNESR